MENVKCMMNKPCEQPEGCETCGFNEFEELRRSLQLEREGLQQGPGGRWRLVLRRTAAEREA